jgi:large subunit ribosomal protein L19e
MNLKKKKDLAARTLNVGKDRIIFVKSRIEEIKEALTKQDIRDLNKGGAIIIRKTKGRKKVIKKNKRSDGKVRKRVNKRKKEYMAITRKLRKHLAEMKKQGRVSKEDIESLRKKIRNKYFKSLANFKEYIGGIRK